MNHHSNSVTPVVLTIGGFDPSSGAGITADLKTLAAHHCYGVAAITALTVQNTQGVSGFRPVDAPALKATIQSQLEDGRVRTIKIGMLANKANAEVVCGALEANPAIPAVLDPVFRSSSGKDLVDAEGYDFLRKNFLSRVQVVTPNLDEAAALTGMKVENVDGMKAAARKLIEMGARAAVVTGGHLEKAIDVFVEGTEIQTFVGDKVKPDNTHGTGCTFSSAIAANLALGRQLRDSVMLAKAYVTEAIRKAYTIGPGRVPLNHLYRMEESPRPADYSHAVSEPVL